MPGLIRQTVMNLGREEVIADTDSFESALNRGLHDFLGRERAVRIARVVMKIVPFHGKTVSGIVAHPLMEVNQSISGGTDRGVPFTTRRRYNEVMLRLQPLRPSGRSIVSSLILLVVCLALAEPIFAQTPVNDPFNSEEKILALIIFAAVAIGIRIESVEVAVASLYLGSLIFCAWYVVFHPLKAIPTLLLFLIPATWWHRSKLGWKGLIGIWIVLLLYCWFVLKELVVALLIFPTFHLLAYRTSRFIDQRYSGALRESSSETTASPAVPEGLLGEGIFSEMIARLWKSFGGIMAQSVGVSAPEETAREKIEVLQMQFQDPRQMSRALTDLVKRDGRFKEKPFLKRVEEVFWKVQKALYSQDLVVVQPFVSDGLFEQLQVRVEEQKAARIKYQVSDMGIYDLRFVQVQSEKSFDTMHILVRAYAHEELISEDGEDRQHTEGGRRRFDEVWAFLRRPDAKTLERPGLLEGFCPNCSAPIDIGQAARCKACDAFLRAGTHDWVLFQVTPACEWQYGEPEEIPGMRDLRIVDPAFTVQHVEDRVAVIFWKERQAERLGQVEPLRRFALPESCDRLEEKWRELADRREYQEYCALGKVRLKAILSDPDWDRLFVETVWSGIPKCAKSGKLQRLPGQPRFFRKILVLKRRHGLATNLDSALSSAHCHSCGAPAKVGFSSRCEYCQTVLNDGDTAWVLDWWVGEDDPELQKALAQKVEQKVVVPRVFAEGGSRLDTVAALAQMMLADGIVNVNEMKLLQNFAAGHGIPPARVEQVIQSLREGWIHLPKLDKRQDAYHLLQSAVRMALADGVLVESEMEMLHQLARHLGYSEADVKYLLARHQKQEFQEQRRREKPRCHEAAPTDREDNGSKRD